MPLIDTFYEYPFRTARLIKGKKRWSITYYAWNVKTQRLERQRITADINRIESTRRREERAQDVIRMINNALRAGKVLGKDTVSPRASLDFRKASVTQAITYFIEQKKIDKARPNYIRNYSRLITNWKLFLDDSHTGDPLFKDLDTDYMFSFFDFLQRESLISNKTFNNYRNDFSVVINWTRKRAPNVLKINPAENLPIKKVITRKHAALKDEQIKAIRDKCLEKGYEQLLLYVHFIYYTLARPGEIRQLRVRHIDLKENRLFIPGEISKNRMDEFVPIAPALQQILKKSGIPDADPEHFIFSTKQGPGAAQPYGNTFWERNSKVLKALSFTDRKYDLYSYKHSGAISLYLATKDIKLVQRQCRHQNVQETDIYLRDLGLMTDYNALSNWKGALVEDDEK